VDFPTSAAELERFQDRLAAEDPVRFAAPSRELRVAAVFACFARGGSGRGEVGDIGWAGAAVVEAGRLVATTTVEGTAGGPYRVGLLALREGPLLARAVAPLEAPFDLLLVNATGRDHPRRAGLAVHLGYLFDVPTIGVTHRPLLAQGAWPAEPDRGARAPLTISGEVVGYWLRTRSGCRPLAVHAAWRIDPDLACRIVLDQARRARTPEPLRQARRLARQARAGPHG
jgi:deoxyribonuclease V